MAAQARQQAREAATETGKLVIRDGSSTRDVPLKKGRFLIGRTRSCDLVLDTKYVSKRHAVVERVGNGYVVSDLGSRNGVYINGDRILGPYRLRDGDTIQIADASIVFQASLGDETETFESKLVSRAGRSEELLVEEARRVVFVHGQKLAPPLSRQEFDFLLLLWNAAGDVCSRDELGDALWGSGNYDYNLLHRLKNRLKEKLCVAGAADGLLESVAGVGYKLSL